jgi:hypothetical protein
MGLAKLAMEEIVSNVPAAILHKYYTLTAALVIPLKRFFTFS